MPRLFELLRREGFADHDKRVERLYRLENLQITQRPKKKLPARVRCPLETPSNPNQVWSMDFVSHVFYDGRRFRCLNIVDEGTKECLMIEVACSLRSKTVVEVLERLAKIRGYPARAHSPGIHRSGA